MINIIGQKKYNQLQKPEQTALHSKGSIDLKKLNNSNQQSSQLQLCDPIDPFESKESVRPFEPGELGPAVEINQQSLINLSEPNLKLMSQNFSAMNIRNVAGNIGRNIQSVNQGMLSVNDTSKNGPEVTVFNGIVQSNSS